jgi:YedE family putative selenium metabolism protein
VLLVAAVGGLAALLVAQGNPPNMGVCGACFLRDAGAALGLVAPGPKGSPACVRPELVGLVLGALGLALARGRCVARSGSHAASRLTLGFFLGVGALVFLGCPFRMLQRLGGGDLSALAGLAGFVPGVLVARRFERAGYTVGKTSPAPRAVGLQGPVAFLLLLVAAEAAWLVGPRPTSGGPPLRAPAALALGVGLAAGALLSATGFCVVSAARAVLDRPRGMLVAAGALIAAYAAVALATGTFRLAFSGSPLAHDDVLWSALSMALVGLAGAFAGGCPVRQLVMTGDEILDAGVQVMAQPPGKKNSTIHLLSGGEKALTAIALVFAIFQLNPAPFCLLDEVDAPLDDANTERYAKLVSQMSAGTQFLFISHNKIAMEMAEQLIGVTMQEQGVSRIVAVDMDKALAMAEIA